MLLWNGSEKAVVYVWASLPHQYLLEIVVVNGYSTVGNKQLQCHSNCLNVTSLFVRVSLYSRALQVIQAPSCDEQL
jgi:hypothetical protein